MIFTTEGFVVPIAEHEALRAERDRMREALDEALEEIEVMILGDRLYAENDRLREALEWMENLDPVLVEAAKEKFALAKEAGSDRTKYQKIIPYASEAGK